MTHDTSYSNTYSTIDMHFLSLRGTGMRNFFYDQSFSNGSGLVTFTYISLT